MNDVFQSIKNEELTSKPSILDLSTRTDQERFRGLVRSGDIRQLVDDFEEQQRELFGITHPATVYAPGFEEAFQAHYARLARTREIWGHGRWVYYPWRHLVTHVLPADEYQLVRTARNQNLISKEEQEKFYNSTVGIAGLSVGSSVALALTLSGGAMRMKLADMDRLALSNTNRVLAGSDRLGMLKVEMAARTIYEMNPYAELQLYPDGITEANINSFFDNLDIVVDEIDNIAFKFLIRKESKKRKIAVVMAADNGDNAVVDIERYDLDPQPDYFHGRLGSVSFQQLVNLDKFAIGRTITQHIGPENITERMQQSLGEMGKTIVSWPQLGGAALINGAAVAYCVRKILNGQPLESNRALVSLDEKLLEGYNDAREVARRRDMTKDFARKFGL
ncbi:hypothetical protein COU19_01035 [Candidatus Kaiserbacteria bacterium CG10_big_fil_rev_8_21_14_0_10_56_12]|uniref:THIF-type NAD/FAD binding fold domain-containing protein n=1 Tax=Candidatus Kaiserbacteria bacterium CG10_big_fil_rev_8_21_14_0_10_56_12 TaxID=1974611 RepID=A0A2H0UA56_9BACT|nr:MAG: hypothetical protein COU19_01035 [Candidatus Kaiserbacteria bacterium CG10_big_fil_rev_8_21_14_0_10_56_12]